MKTVIFGGTTEGRELSRKLAEAGAQVTVSVASEYGTEEQGAFEGVTVSEGLKDEAAIRGMIRGADLVVDATHPYAVIVTENIRRAAEEEGVRLLRLRRETIDADPDEDGTLLIVRDTREAARTAARMGGNILLTTGAKELAIYAEYLDGEKMFPRVLPLAQSIASCEEAGVPHRNILALQGPFSEELNRAVIRDYKIDVMITKESGRAGGFMEKISACKSCGIPVIVIARPADDGCSFDEVLAECEEMMR